MTPQERLKDIESIMNRYGPGKNDSALNQIKEHVSHLKSVVTGAYPGGKLLEITTYAEIYFSQRKHKNYGGGAEQVAVWVLAGCQGVEGFLP